MAEIKRLKKDIRYTKEEVFELVSTSVKSWGNFPRTIPSGPAELIILKIAALVHKEYTRYPEELKHAIADCDKRMKKNLSRSERFINSVLPEKLLTAYEVLYRTPYEDLPLHVNNDLYRFLIQWRFDIKK